MRTLGLLILLLAAGAMGATYTVRPSGGDYTNIRDAADGAANFDTIDIDYGGSKCVEYSRINPKKGQVFLKTGTSLDTITISNKAVDFMQLGGDSIRWYGRNLLFITFPDSTYTSWRRIILTNNTAGWVFDSIQFGLGTPTDYKDFIYIGGNGTYNKPISTFSWCDIPTTIAGAEAAASMLSNVHITNCIIRKGSVRPQIKWVVDRCIILSTGENEWFGDSSSMTNCYIKGKTETITTDEISVDRVNGFTFSNNVMDSGNHVDICIDGIVNGQINNNLFVRHLSGAINSFYNHMANAKDTNFNISIYNNLISTTNNTTGSFAGWAGSSVGASNIRITKSLVTGPNSNLDMSNVSDDSTSYMIWSDAAPTLTSIAYISDTSSDVVIENYYIDTIFYPYIKQITSNPAIIDENNYIGPRKYLTNNLLDTILTDTSFAVSCSLAADFWFFDPRYRDSATVYLEVSTDKSTWTKSDSSVIRADGSDALSYTNTAGDTYYYRFVASGLNTATTINDTSFMDSVVLTGSAAPTSQIYYVDSVSVSRDWAAAQNIATPASVACAFDSAAAGDTVYFRGGMYTVPENNNSWCRGAWNFANSGTDGSPIVFKAYPGERVVLNGTTGGTGDHVSQSTGYDVTATIIGTANKSWIVIDSFQFFADSGRHNPRIWVGDENSERNGNGNIIVKNCLFYGGDSVIQHTDNAELIRIEAANNVTIQNCYFKHFRQAANWHNTSAIKSYHDSVVVIDNCEFYDISCAIYLKSNTDSVVITDNFIDSCYDAIYCDPSFTIMNSDNVHIFNNVIANNARHGISYTSSADSVHGNSWNIYNNTVYGGSYCISWGGTDTLAGPNIYNNILADATGREILTTDRANWPTRFNTCDHNQFGTTVSIKWGENVRNVTYSTLVAWQASTILDIASDVGCGSSTSPGCGSLASNPKFVGVNKRELADFAITDTSPCWGAGRSGANIGADVSTVGYSGDTIYVFPSLPAVIEASYTLTATIIDTTRAGYTVVFNRSHDSTVMFYDSVAGVLFDADTAAQDTFHVANSCYNTKHTFYAVMSGAEATDTIRTLPLTLPTLSVNRTRGDSTYIWSVLYANPADSCNKRYRSTLTNPVIEAYHISVGGDTASWTIADTLEQVGTSGIWRTDIVAAETDTTGSLLLFFDGDEVERTRPYRINLR